jgi:hypothetical protein
VSQFVLLSLVALTALGGALTAIVFRRWRGSQRRADFYWGLGLALVTLTLAQETVVYAGEVSDLFLRSYFFFVALLVGILSLGSAELALRPGIRRVYWAYLGVATLVMGYLTLVTPVPVGVVHHGVITGNPDLIVVLSSSVITFPAAVLMAGSALLGAIRGRRWNLLYIALGILVISAAGGLYIVSFPVTLYYAEFVGVVLLFLGFIRLSAPSPQPVTGGRPSGSG